MSILGPPTVTPARIDAVLAQYASPATGQQIYDRGVQYGIDPAFLLAFFIHESGAGANPRWAGRKPDGTTTHNIGNIVCTAGWRCYGRFRDYASWDAGIEDWYKLLKQRYVDTWQRSTVEAIIPKYAPASDHNDEAAYIRQVRLLVERWRRDPK
jgi:flagellum-specific peptidoglycan hydrolase FlgJ